MKAKDLIPLSPEDLRKKKQEIMKELMKANAQIASGTTPTSPGMVRELKKTVARINTELTKKESTKA